MLLQLFFTVSYLSLSVSEKKSASVTGAAAPQQDITGIYDVLNVSFVPPSGSSLRQLGKPALCNELIIPPCLSLTSFLCRIIRMIDLPTVSDVI